MNKTLFFRCIFSKIVGADRFSSMEDVILKAVWRGLARFGAITWIISAERALIFIFTAITQR